MTKPDNSLSSFEAIHDDRPWGWFDQFTHGQSTTVKIIEVKAGKRLSDQRHQHRDELWVVLDAALGVIINGEQKTYKRHDRIEIPRRTWHRAVGLEKDCRWLEISFGQFDEQDIERRSDDFGRT